MSRSVQILMRHRFHLIILSCILLSFTLFIFSYLGIENGKNYCFQSVVETSAYFVNLGLVAKAQIHPELKFISWETYGINLDLPSLAGISLVLVR